MTLSIFRLVFVILIQIILENLVKHLLGESTFHISVSFIFILNIILFVYLKNLKLYFSLQLLSMALIAVVMLPHLYYFNLFSFYSRTNYISYEPLRFILYTFYIFFAAVCIYFINLFQFKQLCSLKQIKYEIFGLTIFLVFVKAILVSLNLNINNKRLSFTVINQNQLLHYKLDYISYINGENKIDNYQCAEVNNQSPTIRFMYKSNSKKELLLLIESWGILKNIESQKRCIEYLKQSFKYEKRQEEPFKITYGETCFHGNTSAAEGRELLNMNNEESYRAFLDKGIEPQYNIVKYKTMKKYYTIAGFSGSKVYGSSWSNVEGFRKKIGFLSRFYFEDLRSKNKINKENNYTAVNDEAMIDSLINESVLHQKIFAYGLTINTHVPFNLDKKTINLTDYRKYKSIFLRDFDWNSKASDQFFRIRSILANTFKKVVSKTNSFDKILIIGDHASPELSTRYLFNNEKVPYLLIERND